MHDIESAVRSLTAFHTIVRETLGDPTTLVAIVACFIAASVAVSILRVR